MYISAHLKEIPLILNQLGIISVLKQMSCQPVLNVIIARIHPEKLMHNLPQFCILCLHGNVEMVRHKTERMNNETK